MIIKTTLNLSSDVKQQLSILETLTGKKRSELIVLLINIMMNRHREYFCCLGRVRYQRRMYKQEWKRVHISILSRDYDYLLDLRRFCKKSASLIITIALSLYYKKIINDFAQGELVADAFSDAYKFFNYLMINESKKGLVCWKIYWGLPDELDLSS